ncbi:hypothetical protein L6164_007291 [Bauhinia variegata]|uniref:Uncharacterized protein n=1 Tax=Bauhinia variegata TaxID=167791 RepID=A0ACB9PC44_BAUVA|nr:hypothetical protein L6164_007291 [Bauhinia variegata]
MTATHFSERSSMEMESCVPPGFRFHPTEEELVGYYLKKKINALRIDLDVIVEIDLYKIEPWDIQDRCKLGYEEKNEWYFFSHKDKKYPTGTRTNRATAAGFWKATGRDKAVMSKNRIIGMRKTLVFYQGRAPNGRKTDWIMHEYRLQTSEHTPPQAKGWVVCRAFRKPSPSQRPGFEAWNSSQAQYLREQSFARIPLSFADIINETSNNLLHRPTAEGTSFSQSFGSDDQQQQQLVSNQQLLVELPQLDSPTASLAVKEDNYNEGRRSNINGQCIDWKNFDNLFASQLTDTPYNSHGLQLENQASHHMSHIIGCFPADS